MKKHLFWWGLAIAVPACVAYWLWDRQRVFHDEALCLERYALTARSANAASRMASLCNRLAQSPLPDKWYVRYRCYQTYIPRQRSIPAERAAERMCDLRNPI